MVTPTAVYTAQQRKGTTSQPVWPDYVAYLEQLLTSAAPTITPFLLYHERVGRWWQRPFIHWRTQHFVDQAGESVWVIRQPRWPLQHILLIVRGEMGDETAVTWAKIVAHASNATVTILPIIPAYPGMYQMGSEIQVNLNILLQPNTATGQRLLAYKQELERAGISNNFCQHRGMPNQQIWQEVQQTTPDLIVIDAERDGRLQRWYLGEIVTPLLRWVDRPLLITK